MSRGTSVARVIEAALAKLNITDSPDVFTLHPLAADGVSLDAALGTTLDVDVVLLNNKAKLILRRGLTASGSPGDLLMFDAFGDLQWKCICSRRKRARCLHS